MLFKRHSVHILTLKLAMEPHATSLCNQTSHPMYLINKSKVEKVIENCPERTSTTLFYLCKHLNLYKQDLNEAELAWLIFRWITLNIAYDTHGFLNKDYGDVSPLAAFKRGKTVCSGYSRLFQHMSKELGLKAAGIIGWAKGADYDPERLDPKPNHEWNAININSKWYLIDSTWGAGSLYNGKQFIKEYDEYYFCTDPERLIRSHYPEDSKWQLLKIKVSHGIALKMLKFSGLFYSAGFTKAEPDCSVVIFSGEKQFKLFFSMGDRQDISVVLKSKDKIENAVFVQKECNGWFNIKVGLHKRGKYNLVVLSSKGEGYSLLYEYRLICPVDSEDKMIFPGQYYSYNALNARLYSPTQGALMIGSSYNFKISFPATAQLSLAVVIGPNWYFLKPYTSGTEKVYEKLLEIDADYVGVYANSDTAESYATLLEYIVKSGTNSKPLPCVKRSAEVLEKNGIEGYPKNGHLTFNSVEGKLTFSCNKNEAIKLLTSLHSTEGIEFPSTISIERANVTITLTLPEKGEYVLQIYAKHKDDPGTSYSFALEYLIIAC